MKKKDALHGVNVAFIGAGAMGTAMIGGMLSRPTSEATRVSASDRQQECLDTVRQQFGIQTTLDNTVAAKTAQVIVLSVKPQVLPSVLAELRGHVKPGVLVDSIVAGATIRSIATGLEHEAIVRTMPNTPAQVGEGMTVWTATPEVSETQRTQARTLIAALGQQLFVEDEAFLDIATAISGSGPGYVFLMMEALIDAAVHLGFSRFGDLCTATTCASSRVTKPGYVACGNYRRGSLRAGKRGFSDSCLKSRKCSISTQC